MTYTHGHDDSVLRSHRWRTAENSAPQLLSRLRAGMDLLDVGCGPGTITIDLATRVAPGRVIGIDPSEEVLAEARSAAVAAGISTVEFRVGDVFALDFDDDRFDVVHAHQVLQHVRDPIAALVEMRRVCRPDGIVTARDSDYPAMIWYPDEPGIDDWLDCYLAVAHANGGTPEAGRKLRSWAMAAGFSDVTATASAWCYSDDAERGWWSDLWAERITATALADRAVELGVATRGELGEMAASWRSWANWPDAWFAVLHGEVVCTP